MGRKVLFTASTYSHIAHFHRPYLRAFSALGYTVDVACGGERLPIPEARRVIHLPLEKSITAPANFKAAAMLRRELKAEEYCLVSTHTSLAAFFTRLAARGLDTVVVNTCHGYLFDGDTPAHKRALLLGAEKLTAGRTDLLLTMNRCDWEIAQRHRLGRRILSIPGVGVDLESMGAASPAEGAAVRSALDLPEEAFILLYPAEFSQRKSQRTLLEALALLPKEVYLILPGSGALLEECRGLAGRLGVAERVRFPGYVGDMAPYYAAAHCAVSASRSEGLPFNVMEAMYNALPVCASAVKGHVDLLREGENGLLFPYGDAGACAGQIERVLWDRDLGRRLGSAAAEDAQAYGLRRVLPQVMEAYRTVLPELPALTPAGTAV